LAERSYWEGKKEGKGRRGGRKVVDEGKKFNF
jgi:hypothetical protein